MKKIGLKRRKEPINPVMLLLPVPLNLVLILSPTCTSLKLQLLEYCSPPVDTWGLSLCPLQSQALSLREMVQAIKQARISMPCFHSLIVALVSLEYSV